MKRCLPVLAALAMACGTNEPGESGKRWDKDETATETRKGVKLTISYDSADEAFQGSVANTTDATVDDIRVEVHLSNGKELGPTPRTSLKAGEKKEVTLDAKGEDFKWYQVHVEIGSGS